MLTDLPSLREVVAKYKLSADKGLGQHFLLDMSVTDAIARAAGPLDGVNIMEVGPGPGGLTRSLLSQGAQSVTVVEMDERFVPALEDIRDASNKRLKIVMGNGVKVNPADHNVTRIAANLPYNVGTKMLINWLTADPIFWDKMVLMFQKEVAQRIVARPGDKAYGRLAILTQSIARADMLMEVPAKAFTPPPRVDSAVVVFEPLPLDSRYNDLKALSRVTEAAFGMRRKMLRRSLKPIAGRAGLDVEAWLAVAGVDPQRRPETLSAKEFQILATHLKTAPNPIV